MYKKLIRTINLELVIAILVLLFLGACGSKSDGPERKVGWDEETLSIAKAECTTGAHKTVPEIPISKLQGYCTCVIDLISYRYSVAYANAYIDIILDEAVIDGSINKCKSDNGLNLFDSDVEFPSRF